MVSNIALPSDSQIARSTYLFGHQSTTDTAELVRFQFLTTIPRKVPSMVSYVQRHCTGAGSPSIGVHRITLLVQPTETDSIRDDLSCTIIESAITYKYNISAPQQMKRSFYVFIVFQSTPKHPRTVDHRILIRRALLLPEYRINY